MDSNKSNNTTGNTYGSQSKSSTTVSGQGSMSQGTSNQGTNMSQGSSQSSGQGSISKNQGSGSLSGQSNMTGGTADIPAAFAQVVDQAIHALQPRIHEVVNDLAEKAVGLSHQAAQDVAIKVKRNPWYTVGGIALLVLGLGLVFGMEDRRERRFSANLH